MLTAGAFPPDPIVGWRLWRLCGDELVSLRADYSWPPLPEAARCLEARRQACPDAPGPGCGCGFSALSEPAGCVRIACTPVGLPPVMKAVGLDAARDPTVLGLVRLWGRVTADRSRGYRAEHAAPLALFLDDPRRPPLAELRRSSAGAAVLRRLRDLRLARKPEAVPPDASRREQVERAAAAYGVPALTMEAAVASGFLAEMEVPQDVVGRVRAVVRAAGLSGRSGPRGDGSDWADAVLRRDR